MYLYRAVDSCGPGLFFPPFFFSSSRFPLPHRDKNAAIRRRTEMKMDGEILAPIAARQVCGVTFLPPPFFFPLPFLLFSLDGPRLTAEATSDGDDKERESRKIGGPPPHFPPWTFPGGRLRTVIYPLEDEKRPTLNICNRNPTRRWRTASPSWVRAAVMSGLKFREEKK